VIDSDRREVIRKAITFIWNDNNEKERLPTHWNASYTHLLVECLHLELRLDEVWTLADYFRGV